MIHIIYGPQGSGKTKNLVVKANILCNECSGSIVMIDRSKELMYDLKHEIRLVDISDFDIDCARSLMGFICGMHAQNYDIQHLFIDDLFYILRNDIEAVLCFVNLLEEFLKKHRMCFYLSITMDEFLIPKELKKYTGN